MLSCSPASADHELNEWGWAEIVCCSTAVAIRTYLSSRDTIAMSDTITGTPSFATSSAPIHLHHALDVLLQPSTHLVSVLQYAGFDGMAALRSFPFFRERISALTADELKSIGIAADQYEADPNHFPLLRNCLVETVWQSSPPEDYDSGGSCSTTSSTRPVMPAGYLTPRKKCWKLTNFGLLSLATSPLATELALRNLVLLPTKIVSSGSKAQISAQCVSVDQQTLRGIYEGISKNPAAAPHVLKLLVQRINEATGSYYDRAFHYVARHANSTPDVLKLLLELTHDEHTREAVATNPNATSEILSSLIHLTYETYPAAGNPIVLRRIAAHPNTQGVDLENLALHKNSHVREAVARNRNTPTSVLQLLSSDDISTVLFAAAKNPSLPSKDLSRLSVSEKEPIRRAVAMNPSTDSGALARLALDEEIIVRLGVGRNPTILVDDVFDIDNPSSWPVLASFSNNGERLQILSGVGDVSVQARVAGNPCTPKEVLARLSTCEDDAVLHVVAGNPNTPSSALKTLAENARPFIRAAVASNTSTPSNILESFVDVVIDGGVAFSLASNPSTPPHCLVGVVKHLIEEARGERQVDEDTFRKISAREDLPSEAVALMARSRYANVRWIAATNSRLPPNDLTILSNDLLHMISSAVAENTRVQMLADKLSCLLSINGLGEEDARG